MNRIAPRLAKLERGDANGWRAWEGVPHRCWPDRALLAFLAEAEGWPRGARPDRHRASRHRSARHGRHGLKEIERRLLKLETAHPMGAARRPTPADAAFAHAELTKIINAIAAEKSAGDVHGNAARALAELIPMCERSAAGRRT